MEALAMEALAMEVLVLVEDLGVDPQDIMDHQVKVHQVQALVVQEDPDLECKVVDLDHLSKDRDHQAAQEDPQEVCLKTFYFHVERAKFREESNV